MKIWIVAAGLGLVAAGTGEGETPSHAVHPWGRWQPGAWVETEVRSSAGGPAVVERSQLVRADEDGVVLATERAAGGRASEAETHVSWAFGGFAHVHPDARRMGEETIEVEGRDRACVVWEARWEEGGRPMVERSWIAEDSALPLRITSTTPRGRIRLQVERSEDYVRFEGRKLPCVRYRGGGEVSGAALEVVQWMSLDVPGGLVRVETRTKNGQGAMVERRLVSFRGEPRTSH